MHIITFYILAENLIVFPGQRNIVLQCKLSVREFVVAWDINGTEYSTSDLTNGDLPGHSIINETDIVVTTPHNDTSYICIVSLSSNFNRTQSSAIFLYIAGMHYAQTV